MIVIVRKLIVLSIYLGPHKLNGVPLRRVNQIYVIATSTKLDLSSVQVEKLDDKFFKRVRPTKKNAEKDIFDSKKEVKLTKIQKQNFYISLYVNKVFKSCSLSTPTYIKSYFESTIEYFNENYRFF